MPVRESAANEGVHPIRLQLAAPLRVSRDLIVLVQRVGPLAREVAKARLEWLHRKVRQQRFDILVTGREVPPELVLLNEASDVAVDVVVALHPVQVGWLQVAAAAAGTER